MHYAVLVIHEENTVEKVIEPYYEQHYDWFQIGGRWTGVFDGYNPETDPANIETCSLCVGTGVRPDMQVQNGCNGCQGKGVAVKWPTSWSQHPGDTILVSELTPERYEGQFSSVCVEGYGWFSSERYEPWQEDIQARFQKEELPPLEWLKQQFPNARATVVDCHN